MKKLSLIMAVIILSTLFSVPAKAAHTVESKSKKINGVDFYYDVIDNKYVRIRSGAGFIPEEIDGYPVTIIGPWAYEVSDEEEDFDIYKDFSRDWIIPDSVTTINYGAFRQNKFIHSIKIPSSVASIDEGAFAGCQNIKEIELPPTIKTIRKSTFQKCWNLKKVTLGNAVTEIEDYAFFNCSSLTKVITSEYLGSIGKRAFYNCTSLKCLDLSKSPYCGTFGKEAVGYYDNVTKNCFDYDDYKDDVDKKTIKLKKVKDFTIIGTRHYKEGYKHYAFENNFNFIYNVLTDSYYSEEFGSCNAGDTLKLRIDGNNLKDFKTTKGKIIKITKKGKLTALQKGTTKITVTLPNGKKHTGEFIVTSNPKLKIKNKTISQKKAYTVKKGKTLSVKISGKAKNIKNKYIGTKYAKVISKKSASKIKIKGINRGTTTVKVKVNGVKTLKIKVKVI